MNFTERQRSLGQQTHADNAILTFSLPKDTCLKSLQIRLTGTVVATFGSAPTAHPRNTISQSLERLDVIINGQRVVKSVNPWLQVQYQLLATSLIAERSNASSATEATARAARVEGGLAYGTTTHYHGAKESLFIAFENYLAAHGHDSSWLNLKGVSSAELKLICGTLANLETTTVVAWTVNTLAYEVFTLEAQDVAPSMLFNDYKQTVKQQQLTAAVNEYEIDLPKGNFIQGIGIFAYENTSDLANDSVVGTIKLIVNGNQIIKATTFAALQAENRIKFGVNAPLSGTLKINDGFVYLDLLRDGNVDTALDARQADSVKLLITTNALGTYPVNIVLDTHEICLPRT